MTAHSAFCQRQPDLPVGGEAGASSIAPQTPAFSPLYQQIKVLILKSLQAGEWKPSAAIPSEMELAARFKVSQGTVRKAIDELAAENLLVRRQGKGTFVATHAERQIQYRFLQLIPRPWGPRQQGRRTTSDHRLQACSRTPLTWPAHLAMHAGDAVLQVRRVLVVCRYSDHSGRPLASGQPLQGPDCRALDRLRWPDVRPV